MDRKRPVLGGSVRFPQYLGWSWTGCGPRLPILGAKNRTELDLQTLFPIARQLNGEIVLCRAHLDAYEFLLRSMIAREGEI